MLQARFLMLDRIWIAGLVIGIFIFELITMFYKEIYLLFFHMGTCQ